MRRKGSVCKLRWRKKSSSKVQPLRTSTLIRPWCSEGRIRSPVQPWQARLTAPSTNPLGFGLDGRRHKPGTRSKRTRQGHPVPPMPKFSKPQQLYMLGDPGEDRHHCQSLSSSDPESNMGGPSGHSRATVGGNQWLTAVTHGDASQRLLDRARGARNPSKLVMRVRFSSPALLRLP